MSSLTDQVKALNLATQAYLDSSDIRAKVARAALVHPELADQLANSLIATKSCLQQLDAMIRVSDGLKGIKRDASPVRDGCPLRLDTVPCKVSNTQCIQI